MLLLLQEALEYIKGQHMLLKELNALTVASQRRYKSIYDKILEEIVTLLDKLPAVNVKNEPNDEYKRFEAHVITDEGNHSPSPISETSEEKKVLPTADCKMESLVSKVEPKVEICESSSFPQTEDKANIEIENKERIYTPCNLSAINNDNIFPEVVESVSSTYSNQNSVCGIFTVEERKLNFHDCEKEASAESNKLIRGNQFECEICGNKYVKSSQLKNHMFVHAGEKAFKCDICKKGFYHKTNMIMHKKLHTGIKPFKCELCEKRFSQSEVEKSHLLTHAGEKTFICNICEKRFTRASIRNKHIKTHIQENLFKCDVCADEFINNDDLSRHMIAHKGLNLSNVTFVNQDDVPRSSTLTNKNNKHTGQTHFKCDIGFPNKADLNRHVKSHNDKTSSNGILVNKDLLLKATLPDTSMYGAQRSFKCNICEIKFTYQSDLKKHRLTHKYTTSSNPMLVNKDLLLKATYTDM